MRAYITLLSNKSYFEGVLILHRSLKAVQARYPLYCVLSISVEDEVQKRLECEGIPCIRLSRTVVDGLVNSEKCGFSHWNYTFDKLLVWGLTQFEKMVFLDCDMLIVRNIDHLFECEPFSAVIAGSLYPGNEHWEGLNSGIMVIIPDERVRDCLLANINLEIEAGKAENRMIGDQDVIKRYLKNWKDQKNLHLEQGYNVFADYLTYYIYRLGYSLNDQTDKPIFVIHFIGRAKPWMKKTLRQYVWLLKMCLKNPYYIMAYRKYLRFLRN
ncbi:hypothetical protein H6B14_12280 [Phocaeicola coprophilus]|nr:hypothetical protein [Phocaeicola coprophilus]